MILCNHAQAKADLDGRLEYYCLKLAYRMDLDVLEKCKNCPHYHSKQG